MHPKSSKSVQKSKSYMQLSTATKTRKEVEFFSEILKKWTQSSHLNHNREWGDICQNFRQLYLRAQKELEDVPTCVGKQKIYSRD